MAGNKPKEEPVEAPEDAPEDAPEEITTEAAAAGVEDAGGSTEPEPEPEPESEPVVEEKPKKGDLIVKYVGDATGRTRCWGLDFPRGDWINVSAAARKGAIVKEMVDIIAGKVNGSRFFERK